MTAPTGKSRTAAVWVDGATLRPWDKNPRINDAAVPEVAKSIARYGWGAPLLVQAKNGRIIAGHTRLRAWALLQGHIWDKTRKTWVEDPEGTAIPGAPDNAHVPVRYLEISDREADRLAIADNRTSELAGWDDTKLTELLRDMRDEGGEWEFGLGFSASEAAAAMGEWEDPFPRDRDDDDDDDEADIEDFGTSSITVKVHVTKGGDAAEVIKGALAARNISIVSIKTV